MTKLRETWSGFARALTAEPRRTAGGRAVVCCGVSLLAACFASAGVAGDWPQILGPQRNGRAVGERLIEAWPEQGLRIDWQRPIGTGYAGPAVVGNRLILFHRVGDQERVEALATDSGKPLWRHSFPASYQGGINPDNGPRCVPLIDQGQVYLFGAAGGLHCVKLADGSPVWSRDTASDFGAPEGYFGLASTPVLIGRRLLVNVGGEGESGIVAFDADDGHTVWQRLQERPSYAAPTTAVWNQVRHAVFVTRYNALAIDPATGAVRFRLPFGQRGATVNAATPLLFDGQMFLTSNYHIGCRLYRVDGAKPELRWGNDETLSSQYNSPLYADGYLYGIHGREDGPPAALRCVEAETGQVRWTVTGFGVAHLMAADGKLLILTVDGRLIMARLSPDRYQPMGEFRIARETTRALPALAAGRWYCRSNHGNGGTLYCVSGLSAQ